MTIKTNVESNEVFVGTKPFMRYVVSAMMQLTQGEKDFAVVKARGKFISRAVDIAEVVKKKMKDTDNVDIKAEVEIGTDEFENEEGKKINISTISIKLQK